MSGPNTRASSGTFTDESEFSKIPSHTWDRDREGYDFSKDPEDDAICPHCDGTGVDSFTGDPCPICLGTGYAG